MKTNFKKLALAMSGAAALAGASIPAHAIIVGAPGEANLVPFVVDSTDGTNTINTLVRIGVPKSVGNDVIPNCYTAPNTTPTNTATGVAKGCNQLPANVTSENPAVAPSSSQGGFFVHWYFLDQTSTHRLNGSFSVSADDTYLFDWKATDAGQFTNYPGYLVFVTEAGNLGQAASFTFTADAYLVFSDSVTTKVIYDPTIPMTDGADGTSNLPTLTNNVVELNTTGQYIYDASPLVTGERTVWANGVLNNYVFDLPLARNISSANGQQNSGDQGTLAVVWADDNNTAWSSVPAYRFNNNELKCSGVVSLPLELNLLYVPNQAATIASGGTPGAVPGALASLELFVDPYVASASVAALPAVAYTNVCNTTGDKSPATGQFSDNNAVGAFGLDGGFLKIVPQEPVNSNSQGLVASAVMFTIPVSATNGLPLSGTVLGHSRGAFTSAPN